MSSHVSYRCPSVWDYRNSKVALFDGIEEGGIRASSSYSHEIDEHDNERALEGLQDRVNLLKRLSGDINEEVDTHNRMLERMGNDMDASRGVLSGTMDKFKMVGGIDDQLYVSMTGVCWLFFLSSLCSASYFPIF
ncbi:Bet1-like SNARE 1-1 [Citrus sinensis]|nr:Bet1-like SNARE 1-1 [Citrus sinensis]